MQNQSTDRVGFPPDLGPNFSELFKEFNEVYYEKDAFDLELVELKIVSKAGICDAAVYEDAMGLLRSVSDPEKKELLILLMRIGRLFVHGTRNERLEIVSEVSSRFPLNPILQHRFCD